MVEGISWGKQKAPGWRFNWWGINRWGQRSTPWSARFERMCGRSHFGKPASQKKHNRGWGGYRMR